MFWSNTNYWNGSLPDADTEVIVPSDTRLVVDVTNAKAKNIIVRRTLVFSANKDVNLDTGWILVDGGVLKAGFEGFRYDNNVTITLNNNDPEANVGCGAGKNRINFGNHFIAAYSGFASPSSSDICQADSSPTNQKLGKIVMHGVDDRTEWTVLTQNAKKNDTQITVEDATGWQVGDTIALASTDYDHRQAEERTITGVNGNRITLNQPLKFLHFGKITFGVD